MEMKLRHSNNVDLAKTFIASLRGGGAWLSRLYGVGDIQQ